VGSHSGKGHSDIVRIGGVPTDQPVPSHDPDVARMADRLGRRLRHSQEGFAEKPKFPGLLSRLDQARRKFSD